jgi:hypothetical protein
VIWTPGRAPGRALADYVAIREFVFQRRSGCPSRSTQRGRFEGLDETEPGLDGEIACRPTTGFLRRGEAEEAPAGSRLHRDLRHVERHPE